MEKVSAKKQEAVDLYAGIMNEVKVRIAAIDAGTGGKLAMLPAPIVQEHCYLQLRMCCELIALGCMVAHGDITKAGMQKVWEADKIIAALEALHPHFFPVPVVQEKMEGYFHLSPRAGDYLTKADLLALYYECGGKMHRGNLKKLMTQGKVPIQVNYPEITSRAQKIVDLLSFHFVAMLGAEEMFVCTLRAADRNNEVHVALANRTETTPPGLPEPTELAQIHGRK